VFHMGRDRIKRPFNHSHSGVFIGYWEKKKSNCKNGTQFDLKEKGKAGANGLVDCIIERME